jgi:hypothetical protein
MKILKIFNYENKTYLLITHENYKEIFKYYYRDTESLIGIGLLRFKCEDIKNTTNIMLISTNYIKNNANFSKFN